MLLWLFQHLGQDIRAFNVFNYLTLRAVLAALTVAEHLLYRRPVVIRKLTAHENRPVGARATARKPIWSRPARRPWAAR